jgi:excisionase family DNA binding protein
MTISAQTQKAITPLIRGMAQAGTLPRTEANAVCNLLKEASQPNKISTQKPKPVMLTPRQTAKRLGVCTRTVLRMRDAGELKGVKLTGSNKSLRFSEKEIEQFLNVEG